MSQPTSNGMCSDPQFRRLLLVGTVVGFVFFTIALTILGLASGFALSGALGLAVFGALWGGAGFGAMAGAVYAVMQPDVDAGVPAANAEALSAELPVRNAA